MCVCVCVRVRVCVCVCVCVCVMQVLTDPRFKIICEAIQSVVHDDTHFQKGALYMRAQKCFCIKSGLNGQCTVEQQCPSNISIMHTIHFYPIVRSRIFSSLIFFCCYWLITYSKRDLCFCHAGH